MEFCAKRTRQWFLSQLITLVYFLLMTGASNASAQTYAKPIDDNYLNQAPYNYVGLVTTLTPNNYFSTCSGAVVKSPKTMLSAAHCVYDDSILGNDPWQTQVCWNLKWQSATYADCNASNFLRGYYYFTSYSGLVQNYRKANMAAFNADFIAFFDYRDFADQASEYWSDGNAILANNTEKLIVGYPSANYSELHPYKYLMHKTGPFNVSMHREYQNYYSVESVAAGRGNSGGPIFAIDPETQQYLYAGNYVSNSRMADGFRTDSSGVRAMDAESWQLVDQAINRSLTELAPTLQNQVPLYQAPLIKLSANGSSIRAGDSSPSKDDSTDFGVVSRRTSVTRNFVISNKGRSPLELDKTEPVFISGGKSSRYFKVTKSPNKVIEVAGTTNFRVQFNAATKGRHLAWLNVLSNDPTRVQFKFLLRARRR